MGPMRERKCILMRPMRVLRTRVTRLTRRNAMNNRGLFSLALCAALCVVALATILLLMGKPVRAQSSTRHVATTGTDFGTCTYPTNPCRTVQFAVDRATSGDLIKVATGTYNDVNSYGGLAQVVYVDKTVTIRGGYTAPDFTDLPDPEANPTTLDAQGQGRVLYITVPTPGTGISPTIEGLTITGGNATGLGGHSGEGNAGGAVYVYSATASISNCVVYSNTASTSSGTLGYGGGLYLRDSDATLTRNTVEGNTAAWWDSCGGGIYLDGSDATLSGNRVVSNTASTSVGGKGGGLCLVNGRATLTGNTVLSNTACLAGNLGGYGGGLYLRSSDAMLSGNTVQGNLASGDASGYGGGLYLRDSDATLISNRVISNTAGTGDYGMDYGGGLCLQESEVTLSGNTVEGNTASIGAGASGQGGGLCLLGSDATLSGNTVQGNFANTSGSGSGGGLFLFESPATLSGNTVQGNIASASYSEGWGGGLWLLGSDATLYSNAVISNTASLNPYPVGEGGGLWVAGSTCTLINSLIVDNRANAEGSGLWLGRGDEPTVGRLVHTTIANNSGAGPGVYVENTTVAFTNTILAGHTSVGLLADMDSHASLDATLWYSNGADTGGWGTIVTGTVNVWGDPLFVDPGARDYHIGPGSAALDVGVDAGVRTDIDPQPRPYLAPDLGADEYWPPGVLKHVYLPLILRNGP
jgi:hypothetical protein